MDKEISEIAKLTGRITKDPKSKLFVPLAEEYKKAGDLDMAIHVLMEGLKRNPEYVIARSSLGKLLIAKGDLAGAQKEFEDVVKSSPDNLMAQKKLGDLLVLQNSPHDALPHYKIAFSLNPDDRELASLMSDIEAGRDVRSMIQVARAKTTSEKAATQEPSASGASPNLTPGLATPEPSNVGPKAPLETPNAPPGVLPAPVSETAKIPAFSMMETEEPEEVLVVEPLEPEASIQEPPAAGFILPGIDEQQPAPSAFADESFNFDYPAGDQLPNEPVVNDDTGFPIPAAVSEETHTDGIFDTGFGEEVIEQVPEPSFGDVSEKSDDFTTDTLAELYISQGFFEKAVEIYERMLVEKPNSRGLQDKLSWVRDEVARRAASGSEQKKEDVFSAQQAEEYVPVTEADELATEPLEHLLPQQNEDAAGFTPEAGAQAGDYVPTIEPDEILIEPEVMTGPGEFGPGEKPAEENTLSEPGEYEPASGPIEQPSIRDEQSNEFTASSDQTPIHEDFEPREYVPPDHEQKVPEPASQQEHPTRVLNNAGRKETIARLESWLTIIKKEK